MRLISTSCPSSLVSVIRTVPSSTKYIPSAVSPCRMIFSPSCSWRGTSASARLALSYGWSAFSMGTWSRSCSYILRLRKADLSRIRRKVWRSIAHNAPVDCARTVAARGMLYMSASSPKLPAPSYVCTERSSPSGPRTSTVNCPLWKLVLLFIDPVYKKFLFHTSSRRQQYCSTHSIGNIIAPCPLNDNTIAKHIQIDNTSALLKLAPFHSKMKC